MSANLHELTKQLDVLSWNSRSVLNALIRSAMAAGSSSGFTVKRAGEDVTLTRDNISVISDFYDEWEAAGYPSGDGFLSLLETMITRYSGDMLAASLVKHAQIMWMDSSNVSEKDNYSYWLDRIATMENPKWMTNTAPIPLSIRTPIYDENLSTKHFDDYETYLFPSAYYSMDTLGYSGDGNTHSGGGQNWMFDIDERFIVKADRVILGNQETGLADANEVSYGTAPLYSLAGGTNSFAYGQNSLSYGKNNQAYGANSAVAGGYGNMSLSAMSGIFAGRENVNASAYGMIAGGYGNNVSGNNSFAANYRNFVGGYHYTFVRDVSPKEPSTECQEEITIGNCKYRAVQGEVSNGSTSIGTNQIFVTDTEITKSGVPQRRMYTKKSNTTSTTSPFDFDVGDVVVLHSFILDKDAAVQRACDTLVAKVSQIEKLDGGYRVTLTQENDQPIELSSDFIDSLGDDVVMGGKICRNSFAGIRINSVTGYGAPGNISTLGSSAFGYNSISCGEYQTVVGSSNNELTRARFVVGVGKTSYVTNETTSIGRMNGLVVAPGYSYAQTTSYCTFGLSNFTTSPRSSYWFTGGEDATTPRKWDEDNYLYGVEKYAGIYAYSMNPDDTDKLSVFRVFHRSSMLVNEHSGVRMEPDGVAAGVHSELFSDDGNVAIHASSNGWGWYDQYVSKFFDDGSTPDTVPVGNVAVWAANTAGICGNVKVSIMAGCYDPSAGDIRGYGKLDIKGMAYQSLTAYPDLNGLEAYLTTNQAAGQSATANVYGIRLDAIHDCGHYWTQASAEDSGLSVTDQDARVLYRNNGSVHSFVSSRMISAGKYDVASLIIPGALADSVNRDMPDAQIPHPVVSVAVVDSATNTTSRDSGKGYIFKELAYRTDAESSKAKVCLNTGVLAYTWTSSTTTAYDSNPDITTSNGYFNVVDTFMNSLVTSAPSDYYLNMNNATVTSGTADKILNKPGNFGSATSYANKCITATLNSTPTMLYTNNQLFFEGVRLNPMMRLDVINNSGSIIGITYTAFGPKSIANEISDIYQVQMATSEVSATYSRSLYTSKFSSGKANSQSVTDLSDLWVLGVNSSQSKWIKFLQDVLVSYNAGKLCIEFKLLSGAFGDSGTYAALEATDNGSGECVYDSGTTSLTGSSRTVTLDIPIDPAISNGLYPVVNYAGTVAKLYGNAETTDGRHNTIIGEFLNIPVERSPSGGTVPGKMHYCPIVRIYLGSLLNTYASAATEIPVHLEGLVNYEY